MDPSDSAKAPAGRTVTAPAQPQKPFLPGALFPRTARTFTLLPNVKVRVVYDKDLAAVLKPGYALQTQVGSDTWATQAYGPIIDFTRANPAFRISNLPDSYTYKQIINIPDSWMDRAQIVEKAQRSSITSRTFILSPNVQVRVVYDKSWVPILGNGYALQTQVRTSGSNWTTHAYGPLLDFTRVNPTFKVSEVPETYSYQQVINLPDSWLDSSQIAEKVYLANVTSRSGLITIICPRGTEYNLARYREGVTNLIIDPVLFSMGRGVAEPLQVDDFYNDTPVLTRLFQDPLTPARIEDDAAFFMSFYFGKMLVGTEGQTFIARGPSKSFKKLNNISLSDVDLDLKMNRCSDPINPVIQLKVNFPSDWKLSAVKNFRFTP